ncbi:MFS transporter [Cuniculiplasma sp. SKW4]|uniref:MFS transporter n=1 Tax=Cuniculiplasma sp. SKW4 TaxID=3400171 RepID=UPI003FD42E83
MINKNLHDYPQWTKFRNYLIGRNLMRVAFYIFNIFFVWETIVQYNSVFLAGLIPALSALGYLIIVIPEGYILDRYNRGMVFRISSVLSAITYMFLIFHQILAVVYLVALISSVLSIVNSDSFNTIMKEIVPENRIQSAVSMSQGTNAISELAGIIAGGVLLYFPQMFMMIALISLPLLSSLFGFGITLNRKNSTDRYGFKGAYRIIAVMMHFLLLTLIINGLFISLDVFGSGLIHIILHDPPLDYSIFIAGFPFGAILGSLVSGKISSHLSNIRIISLLIIPVGLYLLIIATSRSLYIDILMTILLGIFVIFVNIGLQTIFFHLIPDSVMGRVNSLTMIFSIGGSPIMATLFTLLSNYFYFPYIMAAAAICAIFISLPTYRILSGLPERVSSIVKKIEEDKSSQ